MLLVQRSSNALRAGRWRTLRRISTDSPEAYLAPTEHPGAYTLVLNRPHAKNAISTRLLTQMQQCIDQVGSDNAARTLIICSSKPGSFCAGADLAERRTMSQDQVSDFLAGLRRAMSSLESLSVPTIAAIDGPALGGGLELALACDFRVAGPNANKIGLPEVKLGIIPGAGGTQRAVRLLGITKAKNLIFTGRTLDGVEAKEWGIVDYIAEPPQTALERALQLARDMSGTPLALRAAKMAISVAPELTLERGLDFERTCYQPLLTSKDRIEALNAFREKRAPVFKGE
ncbi:ClpP/crotonase [Exidia glandulosa HHB12029]|uniref:ClpP/crotonase n=1 Tax=Exidia glandulosa HHB12029 TaxID=1314781 RepID=A0A165QLG8_EXIGL|nr:ClpP/crotonase [Exidia glandulosa HHB12029]